MKIKCEIPTQVMIDEGDLKESEPIIVQNTDNGSLVSITHAGQEFLVDSGSLIKAVKNCQGTE